MLRTLAAIICVMITICAGCSDPAYLSPDEINAYLLDEEHGLTQHAEMNGYTMQVTYRPTDLWVQQEIEGEAVASSKIEALRAKYDQYYYFILSLSKNKKEALHQLEGGFGQYSELVQTLSFRMNDYVTLTTSAQDTIPTGDFTLNRTYGLSDATTLLFVFNKEKAKDQDWVQFNLNEFGMGVGNQRFRFKRADLDRAPKIDFTTSQP